MLFFRSVLPLAFAASIGASLCFVAPMAAEAGDISACLTAARANLAANSYRATMLTSFSGTPSISTVDIQKPDRMHETGPGNEMIVVGKKTWMKMNGGPWKSMPGMSDMGAFVSMDPTKEFKMPNKGSCSDAGMGLWKGQPAHVYKGVSEGKTGAVTSTMYQMSDGFVHHVDVNTTSGKSSFDFSNFNSTTVSPP